MKKQTIRAVKDVTLSFFKSNHTLVGKDKHDDSVHQNSDILFAGLIHFSFYYLL